VFLDFLDDVFLLNFSLETPERILDRFAVLNADFGHLQHPLSVENRPIIIPEPPAESQTLCYTSRPMARCSLCSEHPAKRFCPAKETRICASCCGSKREVEIDCPSSCYYLVAGRAYEGDQRVPDPELVLHVQRLGERFVDRRSHILSAVCSAIVEERISSPWLVDTDVIEAFKSLNTTMKTLASGIYYETLPESSVQASLFRRLKTLFDEFMQPQMSENMLKASDVVDVLNFLTVSATLNANSRPRSRQYLDFLNSMAPPKSAERQTGNLIIP